MIQQLTEDVRSDNASILLQGSIFKKQSSVIMLMRAASPAKLLGTPITVLASIQQHRVLQITALPSLRLWFESRVHHSESCKAYSTDISWASGTRTWSKVDTWPCMSQW